VEQTAGMHIYRAQAGAFSAIHRFIATYGHPYLEKCFDRVLKQERPNCIHFQHLMGLPAKLVSIARRAGIPMAFTLHDYWFACPNAQLLTNYSWEVCKGPRFWLNCAYCAVARLEMPILAPLIPLLALLLAYRALLLRNILKSADAIIAPTTFVREWFVKWGIPANRIRLIKHGIELPNQKRQLIKSPGVVRFAYIGGLAWQKGLHVLVKAFNGLPKGKATLSIWGDMETFPEYSATVRHLVSHPGIAFKGSFPREKLWNVLANIDVLVVPSLWYETSSLVIQEAFAAQIPVIASNQGALAEQVQDEVNGLLVPPGEVEALRTAMSRFLEEPGLLNALRSWIRPVRTLDEHVREVEELYYALAGAS
jgi:glycosyltransferase involved in cell wall biosynthesis